LKSGFESLNDRSFLNLLCIKALRLCQEGRVARRRDGRLAVGNLASGSVTPLFDPRTSKGGGSSLEQEVDGKVKEK